MNWIFLDVDGVLNFDSFLSGQVNKDAPECWNQVCPESITNLKRIVDAFGTGAVRIILSSSWRHGFIKKNDEVKMLGKDIMNKFLIDKLAEQGLKLFDLTASFYEKYSDLKISTKWTRDFEILDYINRNLRNNDRFVILDDEDIDLHGLFKDHFVRTKFSTGLTEEDAEKAISILKGENQWKTKI